MEKALLLVRSFSSWIQWAGVIFALAAAIVWFVSVRIKMPQSFSINVASTDTFEGQMSPGYVIGRKYAAHSPDLTELSKALPRQSKLSAWAAGCAIISALLQVIPLIAQIFSTN